MKKGFEKNFIFTNIKRDIKKAEKKITRTSGADVACTLVVIEIATNFFPFFKIKSPNRRVFLFLFLKDYSIRILTNETKV